MAAWLRGVILKKEKEKEIPGERSLSFFRLCSLLLLPLCRLFLLLRIYIYVQAALSANETKAGEGKSWEGKKGKTK